jgi:hypothetical protein
MALEDVKDLEKALRDAIDVIKDLQSTDQADSSVMDRFQKILVTLDFSLIKMRSQASIGNFNLTDSESGLADTPSLFSSMTEKIRDKLESMSRYRTFGIGDIIIKEGDASDTYISKAMTIWWCCPRWQPVISSERWPCLRASPEARP